jgi:CHASE1-domain containing sensor protein
MDDPRHILRRSAWPVWATLLAGLLCTALLTLVVRGEVEALARYELTFVSGEIADRIQARLAAHAQILRSGAALFDASEAVTREEWRAFVAGLRLDDQMPGIQGVGFSLLITPEQLQAHVDAVRREGFPDYRVWPEGERSLYSSILYLEPFSGRNLRAFGYDMFSEPVRRAAMEEARDRDIAALSGRVRLVQETDEDVQAGALMYVPVYRAGMPVAEHRAASCRAEGMGLQPLPDDRPDARHSGRMGAREVCGSVLPSTTGTPSLPQPCSTTVSPRHRSPSRRGRPAS